MSWLLPKLRIFRAKHPETASAILHVLAEKPGLLRRGITAALPAETTCYAIRESLADLMRIDLVSLSPRGEYSLAKSAKAVADLVPVRMSKVEHYILTLIDKKAIISASDVFNEYGVIRAQFLKPVRRLIQRGLVESYDVPLAPNSTSYRRHYTFKKPE
ncbi:hypothetical protein Q9R34_19200 [Enterobacter sp. BRE11]|nr:hypothetical protein [Enterobacter sp. BRE11]